MNESVVPFITAAQIEQRLTELAAEIDRDYAGKTITLIGTLKGAAIFLADLSRKITVPVELDFMRTSSYGDATRSSGTVNMDVTPSDDITGKHVILVEDIIDAGHTIAHLRRFLASCNPASLRVCALLDKPSRRENPDASYEYLGFSIEDHFVVGYGLDYAQRYRNLPYVGILQLQ